MNPYMPPADPAARAYPTGGGAGVSEMSVEMLRQTKPWVVFLSVMSFIGAGFMALLGVIMLVAGALAPTGGPPTALLGLVYVPMAFFYVYPGVKLWKFGSAIGRLMASRDASDLDAALSEQKSFWKYVGICVIVGMVLEVLFIVGAVVVGVVAGASRH